MSPARLPKDNFPHRKILEAYGVRIGIGTNQPDAMDAAVSRIAEVLPEYRFVNDGEAPAHQFLLTWRPNGRDTLDKYENGETARTRTRRTSREVALDRLGSEVRLIVAEYAVDRVFIHAGAVCWKGRAIIMPGHSFHGKSTLTAEMVRRGALYYSDEYAILDAEGFVHPFPKKLSIRGELDAYRQVDHPVEAFGGVAGTGPAAIGMILLSEYKQNAKWKPVVLTAAKGTLEIIRHTLPIRHDPKFTLAAIRRIAETTMIVRTMRGEAADTVDRIIEYFEAHCLAPQL